MFWNKCQYIVIVSIHSFIYLENKGKCALWSVADTEICVKLCSGQPIKTEKKNNNQTIFAYDSIALLVFGCEWKSIKMLISFIGIGHDRQVVIGYRIAW